MASKPQVLTTGEAATVLRYSTATILRMVKDGRLDGFAAPGGARILTASVEKLLGAEIEWPISQDEDVVVCPECGAELGE